jgi:hypothetical protein
MVKPKNFPMLSQLPQEIIHRIAFYLPFEKAVGVSRFMKEKLGTAKPMLGRETCLDSSMCTTMSIGLKVVPEG